MVVAIPFCDDGAFPMQQRLHKAVAWAIVGLLIAAGILALLSTRTADNGFLGIVMSFVLTAIFFVLGVLITDPSADAESARGDPQPSAVPDRPFSKGWALLLIALAILVFTVVVTVFFDSFNLTLEKLIALGELKLLTHRADLTLQVTVGGYFVLLFWLPSIASVSFLVGGRSVPLRYRDCLVAAFFSLGLLTFSIFLVEAWAGQLSIELLFTMMFDAGGNGQVRLPQERWVFTGGLVVSVICLVGVVALIVWAAAALGRRRRRIGRAA